MLLWGIVTLRVKALGKWSMLPLVLSVFGLAGIFFVISDIFAALERAGAPQLFALCWALLGYAQLVSQAKKA